MYKIYCDLDGVLADFEKGYYDLTGIHTKQWIKGDDKFWKPIDEAGASFWANLNWMPDGKQLWEYISKYSPNILSAPSRNPSSKVGKEAWCKMHLKNQYRKLYFASRGMKQMFAEKNRILIDDLEQTILEWDARGGIGIHHTSTSNTIAQLKKLGL